MFGNKTEERLVGLEETVGYLSRQSPTHFDLGKVRDALDEHRSGSRALFERITDILHTVDQTIRIQNEKIDALAAFVGARFVNQPAQPEKVVVEPIHFTTKLEGDEDVELEIVWEDEDADEPDDEASEDQD